MPQLMGQLTAHGADGKVATYYRNAQRNVFDTIFVFNQVPNAKKGNLNLKWPANSGDPSTFSWYRFNYTTKQFVHFADVPNTNYTSMDTLSQGGYMVVAEYNAVKDTFVSWLYLNPGFNFKLYKNNDGAVMYDGKFCTYTDFLLDPSTPVVRSSFVYYNPKTKIQGTLNNDIIFTIRSDTDIEMSITLNKQGNEQYFRKYSPPYKNTRYYFKGSDKFGVVKTDDILYETIIPHAEITTVLPEKDPQSAPVEVRFSADKSLNAVSYTWRFGDGDSIIYMLDELPDTVKHTYYTPKTYQAVLVATSLQRCQHSVSVEIIVDPSSLDVANVFTPNGDGVNDYFRPENTSIRQFEISIYARSGQRVYHYKGSDLRNWEGWDGRINGGKDASEGVYYFVVTATGWEDKPSVVYDQKKFTGFVHLYR